MTSPGLTYDPSDEAETDHGDNLSCQERHHGWSSGPGSEPAVTGRGDRATPTQLHRPLLARLLAPLSEIPDSYLGGGGGGGGMVVVTMILSKSFPRLLL